MSSSRRRLLQNSSEYLFEWHWAIGDTLQKFLDFVNIENNRPGTNTSYSFDLVTDGIKHSQWGSLWNRTQTVIKDNIIPSSVTTIEIKTNETFYGGQNITEPFADQKLPGVMNYPFIMFSASWLNKVCIYYDNSTITRHDHVLINPSSYKAIIHLDTRNVEHYINDVLIASLPFVSGTQDGKYLISFVQLTSSITGVVYTILHSIDVVAY